MLTRTCDDKLQQPAEVLAPCRVAGAPQHGGGVGLAEPRGEQDLRGPGAEQAGGEASRRAVKKKCFDRFKRQSRGASTHLSVVDSGARVGHVGLVKVVSCSTMGV